MTSLAAVVLCAGKGTRMKSELPKVLHPLLGQPLCAYPIARALEVGASQVVTVVGFKAELVEAAVKARFSSPAIGFAVQKEQNGTADAVRAAKDALHAHQGPVLILYGDGPMLSKATLQALVSEYERSKAKLALVTTVFPAPIPEYGRIVRDAQGRVQKIVEHKDCTPAQRQLGECNMGIYMVDSAFLWTALDQVKPANAQRELYLTDLVEAAAAQGVVPALQVGIDETSAVNDRVDLAEVTRLMRDRINRRHMAAGVTFLDPATTYVEEDVAIEPDTVLGPNVSLHAGTRLARQVSVGQGSVLVKATVGEGTEIKAYSVLEDAVTGPRCVIGPFARLRPGTELSEEVHLGNFVETKKSKIGKKSKANHLAYLGDATIGSGVNVGAGTITCNYDGKHKHPTVLGDNVFIGSDTQLVAPVTVGHGAYVGAGTTVTEDVPPLSLAISRTPQVNKEGWVTRKQAAEQAGPNDKKSNPRKAG
jgi:bifunctional UDP-N-acetylglucosamine pyrophosphorylase / glucosamine-1-phosphate N-acetyltransferase